jgi:DNA-binding NtrC family response regulator
VLLAHQGHEVQTADSGEAGDARFAEREFDLVILDVALPGIDGFATFERLRRRDPHVVVVFITAYGTISAAVQAIKGGGFDYITKPFDNEHLRLVVKRALAHRALTRKVSSLEQELDAREAFPSLVGRSASLRHALRRLAKAATTDVTVLLQGESGTGKELAAHGLHRISRRQAGPFVPVNCAAIASSLAEAELFGHERGAFTDARQRRVGRLASATGGTVFLDEVGELRPDVQATLLRVLEEHAVYRLGADAPEPIDIRVVVATNRDLAAEMAAGRFREDLFHRLNQFPVVLPPLRERLEDLPALVSFLIDTLNDELQTSVRGLSPGVMERLLAHTWPGNVRELKNVLRREMVMAESPVLDDVELSVDATTSTTDAGPARQSGTAPLAERIRSAMEEVERAAIREAMEKHGGHRERAAADLGISRRSLFNKLRRYGLDDTMSTE